MSSTDIQLPVAAEKKASPASNVEILRPSEKFWFDNGDIILRTNTSGSPVLFKVHLDRLRSEISDWNSSVFSHTSNDCQVISECPVISVNDSAADWEATLDVVYATNKGVVQSCDIATVLRLERITSVYDLSNLHALVIDRLQQILPQTVTKFNALYEPHLLHILVSEGYTPRCPCKNALCAPTALIRLLNYLVASNHLRDSTNIDAALYLGAVTLSHSDMSGAETMNPDTVNIITLSPVALQTLTEARGAIPLNPADHVHPWRDPANSASLADEPTTHCTCLEERAAAQEDADRASLKNLAKEYPNMSLQHRQPNDPPPQTLRVSPVFTAEWCRFCREMFRGQYESGVALFKDLPPPPSPILRAFAD